jgi:glyoxylase-like metal-dependent hydrolase (beta-lactamase superfamily II)
VVAIPFVPPLDDVTYGSVVQVSPLIRRVIAENPSKFTYRGTGTYIVGHGDVAVIDPGPALDAHRDALVRALEGDRVRALVVTHCHADHSPLAAWFRDETGAPTIAIGPHTGGIPEPDDDPDEAEPGVGSEPAAGDTGATSGTGEPIKIEESIDLAFDPDVRVVDGELVAAGPGWTLRAVHTPGHTSNHLCVALDEEHALFTGDHVMGWSTTVVSPPDGDMRDYLDSLGKVQGRHDAMLWPTHGGPVTDPGPFLDAYVAHRLAREAQVLDAVRRGQRRIAPMVAELYADVRPELHKPAARSVLAHLVKLVDDGLVAVDGGGPARLRAEYVPV